MDPADAAFDPFWQREKLLRGVSAGGKSGIGDDAHSLGGFSRGDAEFDELMNIDLGFGGDGPLLDFFISGATEVVQASETAEELKQKKKMAKRAGPPSLSSAGKKSRGSRRSRTSGGSSRSGGRNSKKRKYKNSEDERYRRNVAEKGRIKKIKETVDHLREELVTYYYPHERNAKKRMPKQRILVLALEKLQDLRKSEAELREENQKLKALVSVRKRAKLVNPEVESAAQVLASVAS